MQPTTVHGIAPDTPLEQYSDEQLDTLEAELGRNGWTPEHCALRERIRDVRAQRLPPSVVEIDQADSTQGVPSVKTALKEQYPVF